MGDYSQGMGWDILAKIDGVSATPANLTALKAWAEAEGGNATWNPFNTTEPWAGSSDYNAQHVKNYPSLVAGVNATVATLTNGLYENILIALRKGTNAYDVAYAIRDSPWGTGAGVVRVLDSWGAAQVPAWYIHGPYKEGSPKSNAVQVIQHKVGVVQDAVFGPLTRGAVVAYQLRHSLSSDGIVGPLTARVMGPA